MRAVARTILGALAVLAGSSQAAAQAAAGPPAPTTEDCLACHADDSLTRESGTSVAVNQAVFSASVHGQLGLDCTSCHVDLAEAELPHPASLAPAECGTCHANAVADYGTSVHAIARATGSSTAATCASCHTAHGILPAADPESTTHVFNLPDTCGQCHGAAAGTDGSHPRGGDIAGTFQDSIHGRALGEKGLVVAPSCVSCHGSHSIRAAGDPASRVSRSSLPGTCGTCHAGIERQYLRGRHGVQLQAQNPDAPVCSDCHSAHGIESTGADQWQLDVIRECGTCHQSFIESYRDTFHGQVTALGFTRVATCAACHGAHEVLPASDPASPVHAGNRVETCARCHEGANENFARYDPHADRHDRQRNPGLYFAGRFMDVLLAGVFGFFGIHTSLWFFRSWKARRARHD